MKLNLRSVTFLLAAGLVLAMAWRALPALSDEAAREGTLTVLWGDPGPDSDAPPQTRVTLTGDDGRAEILDIDPASPLAASLPELNGRRVRVAFAPGSRRAMAIEPLAGGRAASASAATSASSPSCANSATRPTSRSRSTTSRA